MVYRLLLLGFLSMWSLSAYAQEASKIDTRVLQKLYEERLASTGSTLHAEQITEERLAIRKQIEAELQKLVEPSEEEAELTEKEIPKALDRQRTLLTTLIERFQERKADLSVLLAEEEQYQSQPNIGTGSTDTFRLSTSHAGLLTTIAVTQERITVLESFIVLQQSRLETLQWEQTLEQFAFFFDTGKYLIILFCIWLFEKLVRTTILIRIHNVGRRYAVIKSFSFLVYLITILWIFSLILSKQPGIFASLAIVGAGLAISLQDVVKDIIGWMMIYQSNLFDIGDRISLGNHTGEVMNIGIFHTKLLEIGVPPEGVLEHTGKILSLPNAYVLTQPLTNYNASSDFMKVEMQVTITFESNWKKAEAVLSEVLADETDAYAEEEGKQYSRRTRQLFSKSEPLKSRVLKTIAADGVQFLLRFTAPIGLQRTVVSALTGHILERFD
ncbi:hypothetical protein COW95_01650, partial [Candidatus Peregrinibacteria bacterium CG22_combo_CG10-13_8_21_14_all_49_11]